MISKRQMALNKKKAQLKSLSKKYQQAHKQSDAVTQQSDAQTIIALLITFSNTFTKLPEKMSLAVLMALALRNVNTVILYLSATSPTYQKVSWIGKYDTKEII